MSTWEDKPFYWIGPDGEHKVLSWIPYMGYALGHTGYRLDKQLFERVAQLEKAGYPYDMVYFRWNVGGDNGAPDAGLSDLVKKMERQICLSQDGDYDHEQAIRRV